MKIICAWCGETLKQGQGQDTSHGICKKCEKEFLKELEEKRNNE